MTIARWEARRATATLLGDLRTLTATEDSAEHNEFIDARTLAIDSTRTFNWQGVVVKATDPNNLWFRTRFADSSRQETKAILDPPLPAVARGGDQIDVFMHRGTGWMVEEYDLALDMAIRQVSESRRRMREVTTEIAGFDKFTPVITPPEEWIGLWGIQVLGGDGIYRDLNWPFEVDESTATIVLYDESARFAHDKTLRLQGYIPLPTFEADSSTTELPALYLAYTAAGILLMGGEHRQVDRDAERKALYYNERGTSFLEEAKWRMRPNTRWLR